VRSIVHSGAGGAVRLLPFGLVLMMGRLASPWQLIRLAVRGVDSDDASRIAAAPYAIAVTIILADIERMVGELKADLKGGRNLSVTALLKCIHDAVRGVCSELDLAVDSSPPARCHPQRGLRRAQDRDRIHSRPRAPPAAAAPGRQGRHPRPPRSERGRGD
jgi:hypothetical protein